MKAFESYVPAITRMIDELLASEGVRLVDIGYIDNGSSSTVYEIGEKVLKLGSPRTSYNIPNHPRILQPLIRLELFDEKCENEIFACVEITEKTQRIGEDEISSEELYQIYKELRDSGIIWTDIREANIGRLLRKNVPNLNGE